MYSVMSTSYKYKNDREGFLEYICRSDFSVGVNYKDSWKWIERGTNSLNRYTNLGIELWSPPE